MDEVEYAELEVLQDELARQKSAVAALEARCERLANALEAKNKLQQRGEFNSANGNFQS